MIFKIKQLVNKIIEQTIRRTLSSSEIKNAAILAVDHLWTTGVQKSAINDDSSQ
jgi:hypothetical protein